MFHTFEPGARASCPLTRSERLKRARCPRSGLSPFRAGCEIFGLGCRPTSSVCVRRLSDQECQDAPGHDELQSGCLTQTTILRDCLACGREGPLAQAETNTGRSFVGRPSSGTACLGVKTRAFNVRAESHTNDRERKSHKRRVYGPPGFTAAEISTADEEGQALPDLW